MPTYLVLLLAVMVFAVMILSILSTDSSCSEPFLPGAKWTSSGVILEPGHVRFYKDANFTGPFRDFPVGTLQRSLSKGFLGTGLNKENDTYSSAVVPSGLKALAYEHNDFRGRTLTLYAGKHANLGAWGMNDTISSLRVESV